jgi:Holliday junction resolvasome RuvABC DNA-binding subunit
VFCSQTLAALPSVGEFAELHTEMLVSQDMIRLVGFASVLGGNGSGFANRAGWARGGACHSFHLVGLKLPIPLPAGQADDRTRPGVGRKLAEHCAGLKDKAPAFTGPCNACKLQASEEPRRLGVGCGFGSRQSGLRPSQAGAGSRRRHTQKRDDQPTETIRQALKELALL